LVKEKEFLIYNILKERKDARMECKGIITAMVTPMTENQELDFPATKILINQLINQGVDGLFILGTNGEAHLLDKEEKIEFAKLVVKQVDNRIPVYVGVGGNSTRETIELAIKMEGIGADALSVITPYFVSLTQSELVAHYKATAEAVSIPLIIYNMPKLTGINVAPKTVAELAKIKNMIGIKDSSGNLENMKSYIEATRNETFSVLSGSDSLVLDGLECGGSGAVTGISNLFPELFVMIYQNWLKGNLELSRKKQSEIEPFRGILRLGTVPSVLKESMNIAGISVGPARLPAMSPNEEVIKAIKDIIFKYKEMRRA